MAERLWIVEEVRSISQSWVLLRLFHVNVSYASPLSLGILRQALDWHQELELCLMLQCVWWLRKASLWGWLIIGKETHFTEKRAEDFDLKEHSLMMQPVSLHSSYCGWSPEKSALSLLNDMLKNISGHSLTCLWSCCSAVAYPHLAWSCLWPPDVFPNTVSSGADRDSDSLLW